MAANCEELNINLTGYDCLDIIHALKVCIRQSKHEKSKKDFKSLINKIESQYNNNKRLE